VSVLSEKKGRSRPTFEDLLRALGYLTIVLWAVVFLVYPPVAYLNDIDFYSRLVWQGATIAGGLLAFGGSVLRIDLKLELPGIIFALIGPLFYFAAQIYYIVRPLPDASPTARYAFAVYALLPLFLLLPRMYALYAESIRAKRIRKNAKAPLTPEQERQPGAFQVSLKRGKP